MRRTLARTMASMAIMVWWGKNARVSRRGEECLLESRDHIVGGAFLLDEQGAAETEDQLDKRRNEEDEQGDEGPVQRAARKAEPTGDEKDHGGGFDEGAAEIVEDLPAGDGGDGIADEFPGLVRNATEEPLRDLPVAADPAMFAPGEGAVVGG